MGYSIRTVILWWILGVYAGSMITAGFRLDMRKQVRLEATCKGDPK